MSIIKTKRFFHLRCHQLIRGDYQFHTLTHMDIHIQNLGFSSLLKTNAGVGDWTTRLVDNIFWNWKMALSERSFSPADFLCTHVEQDVSGRQAKGHPVNQQGAGVRDQGDTLQSEDQHYVGLTSWFIFQVYWKLNFKTSQLKLGFPWLLITLAVYLI